jgi:hypothetical protein
MMSDDRKRQPRAMGQLSADEPVGNVDGAQGLTIVGGQPSRRQRRRRSLQGVPVGVEKVIYLAAADPAFHRALVEDLDAALTSRELQLRPSELAMLRAISSAQLDAAIASVDVRPENVQRRQFLRAVAVSAVTLAAGGAAGCDNSSSPPVDGSIGYEVMAGMDGGNVDAGTGPDGPPVDGSIGYEAMAGMTDGWNVDAGTGPDGPPAPDSNKSDK